MSESLKLGYSSSQNITFRGEIDLGYTREEWDELSNREQDEEISRIVFDCLINVWVKE